MVAVESQQVIYLRTMKIAAGGRKVHKEARPHVDEEARWRPSGKLAPHDGRLYTERCMPISRDR